MTYLCGADAAALSHVLPPTTGVAALRDRLHAARHAPAAQAVVEVAVHDDTDSAFGHVFAVHILPGGAAAVYMSFIGHYSLATYVKRTPPLDAAALGVLLDDPATLEQSSSGAWTDAARSAYRRAFAVDLDEKKTTGAVVVASVVVCVVPPWNGTHADAHAPGHADAVDELVEPLLRTFSMLP